MGGKNELNIFGGESSRWETRGARVEHGQKDKSSTFVEDVSVREIMETDSNILGEAQRRYILRGF